MSTKLLPDNSRVYVLHDEHGRWNTNLIMMTFVDFEAYIILQLPRPSFPGNVNAIPNTYCWHWDNKGIYSMKSTYRLGVDEVSHLDSNSSNNSMVAWWNTLWGADIPPKIKIKNW